MKTFAELYTAIDETNKTNEKVTAMVRYFAAAPPEDAIWAVQFLIGRRPKRLVNTPKMQFWAAEEAGIPHWLFAESYDAVGDTAEAIALVLPDRGQDPCEAGEAVRNDSLRWWVENRVLPLSSLPEEEQRDLLVQSWRELDRQARFVFNKLITGAFRVGVSQELVQRALSQVSGVPVPVIAHRLMGWWAPDAEFYERLVAEDHGDTDVSRPYPFCLAHPLEMETSALGPIEEWHAEWKWDGIRAQLIRREGRSFIWSRGEDLITDRFPEISDVVDKLPEGTVLDGEILAWGNGKPLKFLELQKRIGRKTITKRILAEVPVVVIAFDVLEHGGRDLREEPFSTRRRILEGLVDGFNREAPQTELPIATDPDLAVEHPAAKTDISDSRLLLASQVVAEDWDELALRRQDSRELNVEGLMLKRIDSPYLVGRKKGLWWKWKIEPLTVDAVMIYATRGNGKRASLYTDYTFGVWDAEGKLVPFAKAYSGLTDEEIRRVDSWVRRNTLEKFGPVRTVKPELVFELAFEGIQLSKRHKSGIAVRFPRIARWRQDKTAEQADSLQSVKDLLLATEATSEPQENA